MTAQIIAAIEDFFSEKIGVTSTQEVKGSIERALQLRMEATLISDPHLYYKTLVTSLTEEKKFIDLIVVPETWFFREKPSFDFLSHFVKNEWATKGSDEKLNILSVPCSTGEEPYSIAIILLEAGMDPKKFQIDGIDISEAGLSKARMAIYRENSFRGLDSEYQNRYFEKLSAGYQLIPLVRKCVRFEYGNILDPAFLKDKKPYNIIFIKNLFIYLNKKAREIAIKKINELLDEKGIVVTSPVEADLFRFAGYTSIKYPLAFAFRIESSDFNGTITKDDKEDQELCT